MFGGRGAKRRRMTVAWLFAALALATVLPA